MIPSYKRGGVVPGKEKVHGNNPENDTELIHASPGEIIIDNETINKGPEAIYTKITKELSDRGHVFKEHFDDGGTILDSIKSVFGSSTPEPKENASSSAQIAGKYYDEGGLIFNKGGTIPCYDQGGTVQNNQQSWLEKAADYVDKKVGNDKNSQQQTRPTGANSNSNEGAKKLGEAWAAAGYAEGGTVGGFDPDKYLSEKSSASFDPDKYLSEKTGQQETSTGDKLQTAAENYGNALTLGYLPQIQAATEPAMAKVYNVVTGNNVQVPDYVTRRDENIKRLEEESARNPKSALAGEVAGTIHGALLTPGSSVGGGAMKAISRGAAYGAGYGALSNPGDEKEKTQGLQLENRMENAKRGAGVGAILGLGGHFISKIPNVMHNSADAAQEIANTQAVRSAGANLKDVRALNGKDKLDDIGKFAIDNGIVKAGDNVHDVAEKADSIREKAGKDLDSVYDQAKKALGENENILGFNPSEHKDEILSAVKSEMQDKPGQASAVRKVRMYLNQLQETYGDQNLSPKVANNIKTELDKEINYARNPLTKSPATEEGFSIMRTYLNDAVKKHVEELGKASGDPELSKKLIEANQKYGYAKQLQNMAEDRVNRETANRMFSLTDTMAGLGGGVAGAVVGAESGHPVEGALGGLAAGLAHKGLRTYGPGMIASAATKARPILENTAVPLAKLLQMAPREVLTKAAIQGSTRANLRELLKKEGE